MDNLFPRVEYLKSLNLAYNQKLIKKGIQIIEQKVVEQRDDIIESASKGETKHTIIISKDTPCGPEINYAVKILNRTSEYSKIDYEYYWNVDTNSTCSITMRWGSNL